MVGEICDGVGAAVRARLNRRGHAGVPGAPLSCQQTGVDSLARQRVTEGKEIGGHLDQQLRGQQLLQRGEQRCFIEPTQRLQEGKVDALPATAASVSTSGRWG